MNKRGKFLLVSLIATGSLLLGSCALVSATENGASGSGSKTDGDYGGPELGGGGGSGGVPGSSGSDGVPSSAEGPISEDAPSSGEGPVSDGDTPVSDGDYTPSEGDTPKDTGEVETGDMGEAEPSYEPDSPIGEDGEETGDIDVGEDEDEEGQYQYVPGQLTAGCYDDNEHYSYWKSLNTKSNEGEAYFGNLSQAYAFKTMNRIELNLPKNISAKLELIENGAVTFTTHSLRNGKAYLFAQNYADEYNVKVTYKNGNETTANLVVHNGDTLELADVNNKVDDIQVLFVIDYTGSMGDECNYLGAEVVDVINKVKHKFANANVYTGAIGYKDEGDDFVTKTSEFTTDVAQTQRFIVSNRTSGGGDFPEAVADAFEAATKVQWLDTPATKLIFHIADAPSHDYQITRWNKAIIDLAKLGVRVNTVASSGIDLSTEYFFRSQSLLSSGQYIYLTDDSGIGFAHHENNLEITPVVEHLNSCMVRVIEGYHQGEFAEPIYYQQDR